MQNSLWGLQRKSVPGKSPQKLVLFKPLELG
jgi:hypothetical protein